MHSLRDCVLLVLGAAKGANMIDGLFVARFWGVDSVRVSAKLVLMSAEYYQLASMSLAIRKISAWIPNVAQTSARTNTTRKASIACVRALPAIAGRQWQEAGRGVRHGIAPNLTNQSHRLDPEHDQESRCAR